MAFQPSLIAILGGGGNPIEGTSVKSTGAAINTVLTADGSGGSSWAAGAKSTMTTKGDILGFSTVLARLGVGANGTILTADSTQTVGFRWAAAPSGTGNITDINTDATPSQTLVVGTTGTDFAIVDDGTGGHSFNLPSASATARGLVTTGVQTMAGAKTFSTSVVATKLLSTLIDDSNSLCASGDNTKKVTFNANGISTGHFVNLLFSTNSAADKTITFPSYTSSLATLDGNGENFTGSKTFSGGVTISTAALAVTLATDSTSSSTGSVVFSGGFGIAKSIFQAASQAIVCGTYHLEASEVDDGNSSTADTIDWGTGSVHKSTLTGSCTYTFTNPTIGGVYLLRVLTGAGSFAVTWPATVKWVSTPTVTTAASKMDLFSFLWDGTNFYGTYAQAFTP